MISFNYDLEKFYILRGFCDKKTRTFLIWFFISVRLLKVVNNRKIRILIY